VEQLLLQDPENGELAEMYNSLGEVISLTRELLADAKQQHGAAASGGAASAGPSGSGAAPAAAPGSAPVAAAGAAAGALLPGNVAEQIKRAQQRQALQGHAPAGWAVGADCIAYYATDGQWYPAKVEAVTEDGKFVVLYEGYGNTEEVGGRVGGWVGGVEGGVVCV
jgi:survival-of-motor-neuron-related-splicing factor 30